MLKKNFFILLLVLTIISHKITSTDGAIIMPLIELINSVFSIEHFVETLIKLQFSHSHKDASNVFKNQDPYTKNILNIVQELKKNMDPLISTRITMGKVSDLVKNVNRLYGNYVSLYNKTDIDGNITKFVEVVLDYDKAVDIKSREIFEYTVVCSELQLETCLIDDLKQLIEHLIPYKKQQTPQHYFYYIYLLLMQTHSHAFQMTDYAFKIIHNNTNRFQNFVPIDKETWRLHSIYRMNETVNVFRKLLKTSPRDIWAAERDNSEEGKTYFKLNNVFSQIFYDATDFVKKNWITCPRKCPKINDINYVAKCHENNDCFAKQKICNQIAECKVFDKHDNYKVKPAKNTTLRRYDSVEVSHLEFDNHKDKSPKYEYIGNLTRRIGASRFSSGYDITCVACKCICDEPKNSDRYFSLRDVMADTHKNFVVTGIRFRKINNEVNLQIQQGELIENGFINQNTVDWKKIITKNDADPKNQWKFDMQKYTLEWHNSRGLILDDIEVPKGHVVVGVSYLTTPISDHTYLQLSLYSASFNVTTGKLNSEAYARFENPNRSYLDIENHDKSVATPHKIDFNLQKINRHIKFTTTGLTTTDAGQSTIPYIDMQDVISIPAMPLSGINMFLDVDDDNLGFLKLKLTTLDVFCLKQ